MCECTERAASRTSARSSLYAARCARGVRRFGTAAADLAGEQSETGGMERSTGLDPGFGARCVCDLPARVRSAQEQGRMAEGMRRRDRRAA